MTSKPSPAIESSEDTTEAAHEAGLRYVSDSQPGIRRRRAGAGFTYIDSDGKAMRDPDHLRRIRSLVIPPAWTDVWISPIPRGHIQATGRDARGRRQYRYHPRWRQSRDENKYERIIGFAEALPRIRRRTARDLRRRGLSREKVLAAVVRLLEVTLIRVGNEEYARSNRSFGLSTMRDRHVSIRGSTLKFRFRGKSRKEHDVALDNPKLARVVKRCRDIPGAELFQYIDGDGNRQSLGSGDVNDYLRQISGEDFTAKDFRTWAGTVLAAMALSEFESFDSDTQAKKNLVRAIESVAERLGNTTAVCRKCYVHPEIMDGYLDGSMAKTLKERAEAELKGSLRQMSAEEATVLAFLRKRLQGNGRVQVAKGVGRPS